MRVLLITLFPCLLIWVGAAIASAIPGTLSVDAFPPNNTTPSTSLFPDESNVGYAGPTATGAEGFAYETAPAQPKRYSKSTDPFTPLVLPVAADAVSHKIINHVDQTYSLTMHISPSRTSPPLSGGATCPREGVCQQGLSGSTMRPRSSPKDAKSPKSRR